MESIDLSALADSHLAAARESARGRSSASIIGDHESRLRSNLIALAAGTALQDHESPGEATLHVLRGSIEFRAGGDTIALEAGTLLAIPPTRHGLTAVTDAVLVLTVVKA